MRPLSPALTAATGISAGTKASLATTHRWYARVSPPRGHLAQLPLSSPSPLPPPPLSAFKLKRVKNTAVASTSSPLSSAPPSSQPLPRKRKAIAPESESSDDDVPLSQPRRANGVKDESDVSTPVPVRKPRASATKKAVKQESDGEDEASDDDYASDSPVKKKPAAKAKAPAKPKAPPKKRVKKEESDEDAMELDEDDDKPTKKKKAAAPRKSRVKKEEDDEDVKPKKAPRKSKAKKDADGTASATASPAKKGKKAKKEEEEEEVFKWWEQNAEGDGSQKWQTLVHCGVLFPAPYEVLPDNVKLIYDGKSRCIHNALSNSVHRQAGGPPSRV